MLQLLTLSPRRSLLQQVLVAVLVASPAEEAAASAVAVAVAVSNAINALCVLQEATFKVQISPRKLVGEISLKWRF